MKKNFSSPSTPEDAFSEAEQYYKNAKETLKKSPVEYRIYKNEKYIKEASSMGYLAALRAIDGYILLTGGSSDKLPTSIIEYTRALRKIPHNGKLMAALTVVYQNLHIFGYYRGGVNVDLIKAGFRDARLLIDTLSKLKRSAKRA